MIYCVLGVQREIVLMKHHPVPQNLIADFQFYEIALKRAVKGKDPYQDRSLGKGYLYPPPALLLVEAFSGFKDLSLKAALYLVLNLALLFLVILGIAWRYRLKFENYWFYLPLCFLFSPFIELLHLGQINLVSSAGLAALFLLEGSRFLMAALGLSVAILTKTSPALFLLYLFVRRRWKLLLSLVGFILFFCLLSAWRYGLAPLLTYPDVFFQLLQRFPQGTHSQSFLAKLAVPQETYFLGFTKSLPLLFQEPLFHGAFWIQQNPALFHRLFSLYQMLLVGSSAYLTWKYRQRGEPLFLVLSFAMVGAANIIWYHHYVFFLTPLLIWMSWKAGDQKTLLWCFLGFFTIQFDYRQPPHGLLIHLWLQSSLLLLVGSQLLEARKGQQLTSPQEAKNDSMPGKNDVEPQVDEIANDRVVGSTPKAQNL